MTKIVAFFLFVGAACTYGADASFEFASIKPNRSGSGRVGFGFPDPGRFITDNTPLRELVAFAYDVPTTRVSGGPDWTDNDRWDMVATTGRAVPRTPEGQEIIRQMMRTMLAERFHLVIHKETKEMPVYALIVGKNGPKLKSSAADARPMMQMGMGRLKATKMPVDRMARALTNQLGRPVQDETGLTGDFDFEIEFAPEPGSAMMGRPPGGEAVPVTDRPALTTALQEQLGLKLESRRGPVETLVIDKAEKPAEN